MPAATTDNGIGALLEREEPLAVLSERFDDARRHGRGSLVLVGGEAGIGKTALLRAFCASVSRVLRGACDPLDTPRPLGPLTDVAETTGGQLAVLVGDGAPAGDIVAVLATELRRERPSVVVLEDLHWADGATLDVLRLLGRRVEALPAVVVATYRDDELHRAHPLRVVLGELPRTAVERLALRPLSVEAVGRLADATGDAAAELHRRTGGNSYYVTELVAAAAGSAEALPATVRDAVLARAARLDGAAREVLDAVAIVPQRAEVVLLEALAGDGAGLGGLDACLASGMLVPDGNGVRFRHEIGRLAVEEALAPHRRLALHRRALAALEASPVPDLARLAHHAEGAGDADAVLRHAPAAAERAARLRAHREASAHLRRALAFADRLPAERRAELLERRSYECYLTHDLEAAVATRRCALEERHALGDVRAEGDAHRWLSRLAWFSADGPAAGQHAARAIELLEPLGPSRELAMAYSNMAQLGMLAHDPPRAERWGSLAIAMAEELGEAETLAHALNNVGTAKLLGGDRDGGRTIVRRSLQLALDAGLEEHVARAYTNLASSHVDMRAFAVADRFLEEGIAYCVEHDLGAWQQYMTSCAAVSALEQDRWDGAVTHAHTVLDRPSTASPSRVNALVVLGLVRARRGGPAVWPPLDEALELSRATGELQRLGRTAAARAEARWLAGEDELVVGETDVAVEGHDRWLSGMLMLWRFRAGVRDEPGGSLAEPIALELSGDAIAAAERWSALGCGYDAALALCHASDEAAQRRGLDALQGLGARPAAQRVARTLRSRGARNVRVGPRAATRENPAGLTPRELEVLTLVCEGLRNNDIAERLFLSERTVAHHVSAILRKLSAPTRAAAAAEAARLGIVGR